MLSELFADFLRANAQAGIAILAVLVLRRPIRASFGPQTGYALWLTVPLVFLASLAPAAEADGPTAALLAAPVPASPLHPQALVAAWAAGALLAAGLLVWGQLRFMALARAGRAGPAVMGVISPRLVTPGDFEATFSEAEQRLIRAHERAHIERNDPKANALIALAQCLCWFNPLAHVAAYFARLDQELACDATVLATRSRQRRLYAQTMLKTQLTGAPLPLGCHWLAGAHPLEVRIGALASPALDDRRLQAGAWGAGLVALLAAYGAWAAKPPVPPHAHFEQTIYDRLNPPPLRSGMVMIRMSSVEAAGLPQPRGR